MLQNAAAIDADLHTLEDIFKHCKEILIPYLKRDVLMTSLGSKEQLKPSTQGNLLIYMQVQKRFLCICLYKEQAITQSNHNLQCILFHFQRSRRVGITVDKIQASTKQTCHTPQDYISMSVQASNLNIFMMLFLVSLVLKEFDLEDNGLAKYIQRF